MVWGRVVADKLLESKTKRREKKGRTSKRYSYSSHATLHYILPQQVWRTCLFEDGEVHGQVLGPLDSYRPLVNIVVSGSAME